MNEYNEERAVALVSHNRYARGLESNKVRAAERHGVDAVKISRDY